MSDVPSTDIPTLFRVTVEVGSIDQGAAFYARLLGMDGQRHPGARHYFDCGGVVLAVLDPTQGGLTPTPGPKSLYFSVRDVDAVRSRAAELNALAPYQVHGEPAGDVLTRPWGERSFYVVDPWGNDLCFVEDGTLYT
ncbi:MAG: VOC family protein [Chloroflexi bacterium]|nr:VOC family protein [Chloroflexota bacterium]MBV9134818.1 VOC family protein [Chloroflexota bacterium]MBV9897893.1 VOC family protein [Chloroflexota bacterium]